MRLPIAEKESSSKLSRLPRRVLNPRRALRSQRWNNELHPLHHFLRRMNEGDCAWSLTVGLTSEQIDLHVQKLSNVAIVMP